MRISDWSSDVCSSDLPTSSERRKPAPLGCQFDGKFLPYFGRRLVDRGESQDRRDARDDAMDDRGGDPAAGGVAVGFLVALRLVEHRQHDIERIVHGKRSEEHTSELQSLMRLSYA